MVPPCLCILHSLPNIVTDVPKIPVKAGDVVTTHSNIHSDAFATISHEQNFCAFPVGARPWSALSENVPPSAVDDDEFTLISI